MGKRHKKKEQKKEQKKEDVSNISSLPVLNPLVDQDDCEDYKNDNRASKKLKIEQSLSDDTESNSISCPSTRTTSLSTMPEDDDKILNRSTESRTDYHGSKSSSSTSDLLLQEKSKRSLECTLASATTTGKKQSQRPQGGQSLLSFRTCTPALSKGVLDYVENVLGFQSMTPVQAATIPQFLSHKDVAVQAVTGSGKTLAFLIPALELILRRSTALKRNQIGALVLSPTRELAHQIHAVAVGLCAACQQPEPLLLVGGGSNASSSGTNSRPVTMDLQAFGRLGSDLVIGTPGRVDDILNRYSVIDTSELECLILDEADVLLNMGFATTITNILSRIPKMRRTGLFSATQSQHDTAVASSSISSVASSLKDLMHRMGMRNPFWIDVAVARSSTASSTSSQQNQSTSHESDSKQAKPTSLQSRHTQQATPSSLTNYYTVTTLDEKLSRLVAFLEQHTDEKIIVFFLTCACVDFYGTALQQILGTSAKFKKAPARECTIQIEMLHGKMVQKRREKSMERFRLAKPSQFVAPVISNHHITRNPCESENHSNDSVCNTNTDCSRGVVLFCTDVAARGLDVTDVQWVIQFDAPQDPAFYIHRVGRTARAGRTGKSLLFLTPKEEAYVDFLRMRKVPIDEWVLPEAAPQKIPQQPIESDMMQDTGSNLHQTNTNILDRIRQLVLTDRDILEKGTKAFTSFIRAYKEHHCGYIFRFASLDLGIVANSFCLLRLPKMPELRDVIQKHRGKLPHFTGAGPEIDIFSIPYKDKQRETARQKRIEEIIKAGGKNAKEIKAERRKAEKERRILERREVQIDKGRNPDKKRGRNAQLVDEWEDLAKEERLYKKLRKKQITEEQYNTMLHQSDRPSK